MVQYNVIIQEAARIDILSIVKFILEDFQEPVTARKIYSDIVKEILSLQNFPKRARLLNDEPYKSKGYRVTYVKNYSIFYKVIDSSDEVHIMRVLYNRRDWKNIL